ncbi:MAG: 50S ribosomal protein L35 [Candidatus Omnitrophica bacterium]|nr:50S ribosomal protein L35 [Candidatus Omnitrophota bacterium]
MPKLKTNKSAKKRIRISKRGKGKHFKAGRGHLLMLKRPKRKRQLGRAAFISEGEMVSINKMLPYGA